MKLCQKHTKVSIFRQQIREKNLKATLSSIHMCGYKIVNEIQQHAKENSSIIL